MRRLFRIAVIFLLCSTLGSTVLYAQNYSEGPRKCQKCHEAEVEVWKGSKHSQSFAEIHKKDEAKKVLDALGGGTNMRSDPTCALCHFTQTKTSATAKPIATSGPSCESCHGPSSEWRDIHNAFGDGIDDPRKESAANKQRRIIAAKKAGMIMPSMTYDIAANCTGCHGLARKELNGETASKMIEAGHPKDTKFELVAYSQGSVRHRFYAPNSTVNAEMSEKERARLYVVGRAAQLVSASLALAGGGGAPYAALQKKRADDARKILETLSDISEVKALLENPTHDSGRALSDALIGRDISEKIKGLLPGKQELK